MSDLNPTLTFYICPNAASKADLWDVYLQFPKPHSRLQPPNGYHIGYFDLPTDLSRSLRRLLRGKPDDHLSIALVRLHPPLPDSPNPPPTPRKRKQIHKSPTPT